MTITAPTISLATSGVDPKVTGKGELEGDVNAGFASLADQANADIAAEAAARAAADAALDGRVDALEAPGAIGTANLANGAVETAKVADGAITTGKIADANVTAAKVASGAVTEAKIGSGAVTAAKIGAGAVETAKLADSAVTNAKLADVATATIKGRAASGTGAVSDLSASQVRAILNVADGATANAPDAALRDRATHTGQQPIGSVTGLQAALDAKADSAGLADVATSGSADDLIETAGAKVMTAAERTKLAGIASGATANSADDYLLNRANHTGVISQSDVAGLTAALAAVPSLAVLLGPPERPGEQPTLFTTSLAGGAPTGLAALGSGSVAITADGAVWRQVGPGVVAQRGLWAVEPGRLYEVRAAVRRHVDPADPEQDAVSLRVAWYASTKAALVGAAAMSVVETVGDLLVASGRVALIGTASRGSGATVTAPAQARFARAYVETFGAAPVATDVELVAVRDVTEAP